MNGIWSKLGNAAEKRVVCEQWIRMLLGRVEKVQWEAWDQEGFDCKGVDLWVEEEGRRIAIQCKTKSTGRWLPSDLDKEGKKTRSISSYMREQLIDRPNPADEYHFYTNNTSFQGLSELLSRVEREQSGQGLSTQEEKVLKILDFETFEQACPFLKRIFVHPILNEKTLEDLTVGLVQRASITRLINALHGMPEKKVLGRGMRVDDLRSLLHERAPGIEWKDIDPHEVLNRVHAKCHEVLNILETKQALPIEISREETEKIVQIIENQTSPRILVHGGPGSGKSHVLASVVRKLESIGKNVLLTRAADIIEHSDFLSPENLKRTYRNTPVVFVDQWDSLELAGGDVEKLKGFAFKFCRECMEIGMGLVVGCRTVDTRDSSLRRLFETQNDAEQVDVVEIGLLPVTDVESVLNIWHIPWNNLGQELQGLIRNPECLGLLGDLASDPAFDGSQPYSQLEFVHKWILSRTNKMPGSIQSLDHVVERMERLGTQKISFTQADQDGTLLEESGLFVQIRQDGISYFEPRHQLVIDTWIATKLGKSASIDDLLKKLPSRYEQHFVHARRLRLAVPMLSGSAKGLRLLNQLQASEAIRHLVKRGMWLGLADVQNPTERLFQMVHGWMDEKYACHLLTHIFAGHAGWLGQYISWALAQGDEQSASERDQLVGLFASVSGKLGDKISDALELWSKKDPNLLQRGEIDALFWQQPAKDSDRLFERRLQWHKLHEWMFSREHHLDWDSLFTQFPRRALSLLKVYLERVNLKECVSRASSREGPLVFGLSKIPEGFVRLGREVLEVLSPVWKGREIPDSRWSEHTLEVFENSELDRLVKLIAKSTAHALANGDLTFQELLDMFPSPLRKQDMWMILETGTQFGKNTMGGLAAKSFAQWLMEQPEALRVGIQGLNFLLENPRVYDFLGLLTPCLEAEDLETFLNFLCEARDDWTITDERRRLETFRNYGVIQPNEIGQKAHRLLASIPDEIRASVPKAQARYLELSSKFGPMTPGVHRRRIRNPQFHGMSHPTPLHVMRNWPVETWRTEILSTPHETDKVHLDPNTNMVKKRDLKELFSGFRILLMENPKKYFELARQLSEIWLNIPLEHVASVLDGFSSQNNPNPDKQPDWEAVETAKLAVWIVGIGLHQQPGLELTLARVVHERVEFRWPDAVYNRLIEIAHADSPPAEWDTDSVMDIMNMKWNVPESRSILALAASAAAHRDLAEGFLGVAEQLCNRESPAVLASTVNLATACFASGPGTAAQVIFRCCANPRVRSLPSSLEALFLLLNQENKLGAETQDRALDILLENIDVTEDTLAQNISYYFSALLWKGLVDTDHLWNLLAKNPALRSDMAWHVADALSESDPPEWALVLAGYLANDMSADVREYFAGGLAIHPEKPWMDKKAFVNLMLTSRLALNTSPQLLDIFDQSARLPLFMDGILRLVNEMTLEVDGGNHDPLSRARKMRASEGLLRRLAESLHHEERPEDMARVLDLFDSLLERYPSFGTQSLRELSALG